MVITVVAWIVGLAIMAAELVLCFLGGRWLRYNHRTVWRLFGRLARVTRVLILVLGGAGAVLAVSDFFFPSGDAEGDHIAAIVIVWTIFVASALVGLDLAVQAGSRALQAYFAKPSG